MNNLNLIEEAKKYFGITANWKEAFYINVDGTMLDGTGGNSQDNISSKNIDHDEISGIVPKIKNERSAILTYLKAGNIKLKPKMPGLELIIEPTDAQYVTLSKILTQILSSFTVSFRALNGDILDEVEYDKDSASIIQDIKDHFKLLEVYPKKGETKKEFISRFMSETKDEYKDVKQRFAIANSYWERKNLKEQLNVRSMMYLTEATRNQLIAKSRNAGEYKNKEFGRNRFERKRRSKVANQVKSFNQIDMNDFFKRDILTVDIPVIGETNNYNVTLRLDGVCAELAKNIKNNSNKFEFKTVIQALTKVFNTGDVYVKCQCEDFKYNFAHWAIVNKYSTDDSAHDPGPGKGIANPNNDKGIGCKHILLVLSNQNWFMKLAAVVNNYINYASEKMKPAFGKFIFPKLYGGPISAADELGLIDDDTDLLSEKNIIDAINEYGKNRGKFKPGTNKNPVTIK